MIVDGRPYCPVTGNAPTRMLESSFRRLCALQQEAEHGYCPDVCRGGLLPPGLVFIELENFTEEGNSMAGPKVSVGKCDLCGEKKHVRFVREKSCCGTCEGIWRNALNSPELVIDALRKGQGQDWLDTKCSNQVINVSAAEKVLDDLRQTEEKLRKLEDARRLEKDELQLWMFGDEDGAVSTDWNVVERAIALANERDRLIKVVAELESAVLGLREQLAQSLEHEKELGQIITDVHDENDKKIAELESSVETGNRRIAALELEGMELAAIKFENIQLRGQLAEASVKRVEQEIGPVTCRDTILLDLAIDVIDGRVQGLDGARLRDLRAC